MAPTPCKKKIRPLFLYFVLFSWLLVTIVLSVSDEWLEVMHVYHMEKAYPAGVMGTGHFFDTSAFVSPTHPSEAPALTTTRSA